MMAAILNSASILNSAILDSAILHKENFTHSFWLNLMMAAILNSAMLDSDTAILDSDTLLSSLRFTQKHSLSTLTLTQTNSIWLKLIHSHLTWWWQPYCILNSAILDSAIFLKTLTPTNSIWLKVIHSDSTWWWQPSWIQPFFTKINFTHSFWLNLMMAVILNSANLDSAILHKKKPSLIHSDSTWWWQPSWILPCWIQILPSWIQTFCYLLSDLLKNTLTPFWLWLKLIQSWLKLSHSHLTLILTQTWWWQPSWILPCWIQPS